MGFKILGKTVVDESLLKTLENLSTSNDKKVKDALADKELTVEEVSILNQDVNTDFPGNRISGGESIDITYKLLDQTDLDLLNKKLKSDHQITAKQFGDLGLYVAALYHPHVATQKNDFSTAETLHTPIPADFKKLGFEMTTVPFDLPNSTRASEHITLRLQNGIGINPLPEGGVGALLPGKPPLFTSIESTTSAEGMQLIIKTNYNEVYTIDIEYGNPIWTGTFLNSQGQQIGNVEQYELFAVRPAYDYAKSHIQLPTYAEDVSFKDRAIDYVFGNADGSVSDFERRLHQKFMERNSHGTAYVEITTDHDNLVSVKSVEQSHEGQTRGQDPEYLAINFNTETVTYKKFIKSTTEDDTWNLTDQPNLPKDYEFLNKEK